MINVKSDDPSAREILVVEDDRNSLEFLATLLAEAGYRVRPADSGELALRSVAARTPALILLDVRLPGIDGIEVCRRLKADSATRDVPVLFISARHENDLKVKALEAGGVDYVTKPFSPPEILARIKNHVRMHRLQVDLAEKSAALAKEVEVRRQAEAELERHRASLERQVAERTAELRQSEELFRTVFEQAAVGIAQLSQDGAFLQVNTKFCRIVGYRKEEFSDLTFRDITHPDDLHLDEAHVARVIAGEIDAFEIEKRYVRKDGRPVWIRLYSNVVRDEAGGVKYAVAVVTDISLRKEAEQALQESEEKFRTLVETISDVIFEVDAQGTIIYVSPVGARIWGGGLGDVVGRNFMELVHLEDREQLARRFVELAQGVERPMVYRFVDATGRVLWGRSHSTPIWKDGRFAGARGTLMDITAQKEAEAEREQLQEKLAQARKMESVGRLAGGVAHDFNNMLGVILGHTEMAREAMDPSDSICEDLEEIRRAAERSADLTRQLLAYARKQPIAPRVLDLNATVAGMLRMLQRLIGEDIRLAWTPGADLWPLRMDPSQVDQILANLCLNARDAIDGGGTISIETDNETLDAAFCERNPGFAPGAYVRLTVRDDGRGMDEGTLANLFEPFFTTKEVGQGTGLGLATLYGIVKQNDGFVTARSAPGQGAVFHIYLPRHAPGPGASPPAESPAPPVRGRETILLVEDEPAILKMTAMMLERLGYEVLTAAAPDDAVRLAEGRSGGIDLLMTDVVMPGMNGRELALKLERRHPKLRCLFMSGYTADVMARHGILEQGLHIIQKPFSKSALAAKVREVMGD